jgi:predicted RNA-binding protein with EMAP domain
MRDEAAKIYARTDIQVQKKRRKTQNVAEIKAKMSRLKDLYVDGLIDKEEYLKDREKLMALLEKGNGEPDESGKRLEKVREIFLGSLEDEYSALGRAEKRDFWRAILTRIEITDGDIRFYF